MSLAKRGVLVFDLWCGNKTDGWDTLPDSKALTVFKCDQCDNTFKSRNHLNIHIGKEGEEGSTIKRHFKSFLLRESQ